MTSPTARPCSTARISIAIRTQRSCAGPRRRGRWRTVSGIQPERSADVRQRAAEAGDLRYLAGFRPSRRQGRRRRLRPFVRRLAARADPRRRCRRRRARRLSRHLRRSSRPYQRTALRRRQSARRPRLRDQGQAACRNRRLCARQGSAGAAGLRQPRRDLAGGRNPAAGRRKLSRRPPAGAGQYLRRRRTGRPAGNRQQGLWRPRRLCALHRDQGLARRRRRRDPRGAGQSGIDPGARRRDGRGARPRLARRDAA